MGTDIWFYVEKRHYRREYQWTNGSFIEIPKSEKELNDTARWVSEDRWKVNPNYYLYPEENISQLIPSNPHQFYRGTRNYDLFSILSNTRNDRNLKFISAPRGLPSDLSPELREVALENKDDFYDHSWLLLEELLQFNWEERFYCDTFMEYRNVKQVCSDFILETIPKLSALGEFKDVRVIFWFG
ncbi:hypothetical protein HP548_30870 [Paenibacillus taichungensis]|uniref:Uncharacterized protein n=1 Tax=Paenibacillus taichungensis TaxID=484184 RepID=A0ABX2MWQ0_9BACL|nr:hypothetical protein [Paenibacillus taichungensis]NUU58491.1 hypothetical protein [Paenibacillus taichungensis]